MQYCAACALGPSGGQRQHCGAVAATDPDSEASVCNCTLRYLQVTFGKLHPRPHRYGAGVMMLMRTFDFPLLMDPLAGSGAHINLAAT